MTMSRREFCVCAAGGAACALRSAFAARLLAQESAGARPKLGVCDWSVRAKGLAAMEIARKIGLEGVQISPNLVGNKLSFADPKEQEDYREAMKKTRMQIASLGLTMTNTFPLATDPRGPAWLDQLIDATNALGVKVTLLACFANGDLMKGNELKTREIDQLVGRLKEAAPKAKEKGVVLGLESWLSAKDTLAILDRVGSEAAKMYYDIANSTLRGYDVPAEIRTLKGRICEFHFKDNKGRLGHGDVKIESVCEAIKEIGYKDWIVFEGHYGDMIESYRQNAQTTRRLLGLKQPQAA